MFSFQPHNEQEIAYIDSGHSSFHSEESQNHNAHTIQSNMVAFDFSSWL